MADKEKIILTLEANDEASKKLDAISKALRNMDKEANNVGNSSGISNFMSGFEKGVQKINSVTRQYNHAMGTFNRTVIHGIREMGSAIYDFTSDSINNFTEFSEQHAKVLGAMAADYDKTAESQAKFFEDAQKLKDQALQIGTYGFGGQGSLMSVTEVSLAQESLVKAGIDPDDIIDTNVLRDVLTFAQGNQLNTDSAVSTAVTLGNQFNIPMEDWGEMLDKVSHTADMSIVEVSDIVQSLKWASGISAGLGRGGELTGVDKLNETLGMLTILGDFGLKGSQAGTGIQAMLTRMLTGDTTVITQAQAEIAPGNALEKFYEFEKLAKPDGNLLPMADVIDELNTTMEDMTDEEQAWFAKKLFGLYQMKSAYALMNGEDTNLNDIIKEIEELSLGTNENKLQQLLESQYGQLTSLNNLWEGVKTDVGDRLSPFVNAVRDELFSFLSNDGNYNINFGSLKAALDESCDLIEEKYGTAIANAVRNIGDFTIDLTQIGAEIAPELGEGLLKIIGDAVDGGGIFGTDGIIMNWGDMIDDMYDSVDELPQSSRDMGYAVVSVIDWIGKLTAINVASEFAELISSALQILTVLGSAFIKASTVIVSGPTGGTGTGAGPKGTTPTGGDTSTSKNPKGTVPTGGVGPAGKTLKNGKSVVGSADDIAKASGMSTDDVVKALGKKSAYTVDDIAKATGNSVDDVIKAWSGTADDIAKATGGIWGSLSKTGKALGVVGTGIQIASTGYEAYHDFSSGDTKGGVEAIGGGIGALGGGALGAKAGAIIGSAIAPGVGTAVGTVLGAIIGSLTGDWLGRETTGLGYDVATYKEPEKSTTTPTSDYKLTVPTPTPLVFDKDGNITLAPPQRGPSLLYPDNKPIPGATPTPANVDNATINANNADIAGDVKVPTPTMDNTTINADSANINGEVKIPESKIVAPKSFYEDFQARRAQLSSPTSFIDTAKNMLGINANSVNINGEVKIPEVKMPEIEVPEIKMPEVKASDIKLPEGLVQNTIEIDDTVNMQPTFSVAAPNVNVSVKVDKDEKVTKHITILNPQQNVTMDNWYSRTSSQYGKTNK